MDDGSETNFGYDGAEVPKISMSRAYEDSPLHNCTRRMEVDTPESGEFRDEISENIPSLDRTSSG